MILSFLSVISSSYGDFFIHPAGALAWLESSLENMPIENAYAAIEKVYEFCAIETPGIRPGDWHSVLGLS